MRAGDCVRHRPTGEKWRVAYVRGDHLAWCGWPPGEALVSDCDILELCSDEEHASALAANDWDQVESGDRRREVYAAQLVAIAKPVSATLVRTPLSGVQLAFDVLAEALDAGGYSAGRIVERLRESGVAVTVSDLHGHGLQAVANAISDASTVDDLEATRAELEERASAEAAVDAMIGDADLALRTIAAWLTSPHCDEEGCVLCARDVEIAKGILDGDWLGGADDADHDRLAAILSPAEAVLAEAVQLLRLVATHRDRDTCPSCGARDGEACPTDCALTAFLSRHPAPGVRVTFDQEKRGAGVWGVEIVLGREAL